MPEEKFAVWDLFFIENQLHDLVSSILKRVYGDEETKWWREIPIDIRDNCQKKRERDKNPEGDPFVYSDLNDLNKIILKKWKLFSVFFNKTYRDTEEFSNAFERLSYIRNKVMHPIRKYPSLEDFFFVHEFLLNLRQSISEISNKYQINF